MSKEPILEIKQNEIKRLKASTVANPTNTIFVNLKITRYTRLIVMTDLFKNKNVRHSVDFNKINFNKSAGPLINIIIKATFKIFTAIFLILAFLKSSTP